MTAICVDFICFIKFVMIKFLPQPSGPHRMKLSFLSSKGLMIAISFRIVGVRIKGGDSGS